MSVIEIQSLLTPFSPVEPAGANVEYDPEYFALETLAKGTEASEMGEAKIDAQEPDWRQVKGAALKLFARTRDLRVAMILTVALLKEDGLAGFRDGAVLLRGFIEKLWADFFPKLDPEDKNDPTVRVNILKALQGNAMSGDIYKFRSRLKGAVLTNSQKRIGKFSFHDVEVARGDVQLPAAVEGAAPVPAPPSMALINAAFEDTATESLIDTQTAVQEAMDALKGMDAALAEKAGSGVGPDLTELLQLLSSIKEVFTEQLAKRGIGEAPKSDQAATTEGAGMDTVGTKGVSGEISSRSDVVRTLDKIKAYYEKYEPASPVPIFLERAKRLVTMSFVDLMKDLVPEAMPKIEVFTGSPPSDAPPAQ